MTDIIFSGRFYYEGSFRQLMVGVKDGIITEVGQDLRGAPMKELDGGIVPASTDTHVHFRDPGETKKEDFVTGSTSAIYGGTTTVFDMPNNRTPIDDYNKFADKLAAVKGRAYCDYGLYSLFTGKNSKYIHKKSSGIKIYLGGSTNSTAAEILDEEEVSAIENMKIPVYFHAESEPCLRKSKIDASNLREYNLSRPPECEKEAIKSVSEVKLSRKVATHISSYSSINEITGRNFITEVTPHHLLLDDSMDLGSYGKVNPPLRDKETKEALLSAYLSGRIDNVSSDHAPHTEADKEEFAYSKAGIIGVETRVPLLLALVQKKILDFDLFYRTAIASPANTFGIRKGKIEKGYYADFFTFRLSDVSKLNENKLHSKLTISPFNGFPAIFPDNVIMRGIFALEKGEIIMDKTGRFVGDL